jgi:predicted ATP-dependent endonuclease of OLD family
VLDRFHEANNVKVPNAYQAALSALTSNSDSLSDSDIAAIKRFAQTMLQFPDIEPKPNNNAEAETVSIHFWKLLQELVNYGEGQSPSAEAAAILGGRRPEFVLFTEEDRDLRTTYHLESEIANPPRALENLTQLAELDARELHSYADPAFAGQRTTLLYRANETLKERFKDVWPQHDLTVRVDFNHPNLEITVSAPDNSFSLVTERSDGLRSFVALRAFLAKHRTNHPPVLLVDEAETHLHYDAQANLVDMFTKQSLAAKVIYTTHSAGCLPMDLGNGIRVFAPQPGLERSVVRKSIWDGKFAGFTPLVFAMGATTFAFLPSRNVLMAEGESDAMILPTLLRESIGATVLPFQVAPGISNSSLAQAALLEHEGSSVMYLTDGDQGGKKLQRKLIDAKVKKGNILDLESYFGPDCVLEDLIDSNRYVEAVNWVISTYQPGKPLVQETDLPTPKRTDHLNNWCQANVVKVPDKVVVCQRLLDQKAEAAREGKEFRILDTASKTKLAKLTRHLLKRFPQAPSYGNLQT